MGGLSGRIGGEVELTCNTYCDVAEKLVWDHELPGEGSQVVELLGAPRATIDNRYFTQPPSCWNGIFMHRCTLLLTCCLFDLLDLEM